MIENLKDVISSDYTKIVAANELEFAAQLDKVCHAIYEPIRAAYALMPGYIKEADLGLGCGFPFLHAGIKEGDMVLDLGCAAGIDSFIAGTMTGVAGEVLGIDLTQALIHRGRTIASAYDIKNVRFETGDIETFDFGENWADVIITNGVFSLLPDLDSAFAKAYKALKPGASFCMADITKNGKFTHDTYLKVKKFTGCLNGIRLKQLYLDKMATAGFKNIETINERQLTVPVEIIPQDEVNGLFITTFKMTK